MDEQQLNDDSHYEISLTATQAFVAFVLLLLSLAASFAFGVMVGRGQLDPSAAKKPGEADTTVITERPMPAMPPAEAATDSVEEAQPEASATGEGEEIVASAATEPDARPAQQAPASEPASTAKPPAQAAPPATPPAVTAAVPVAAGPAWAQLLATSDAKRAEALAAKLIDGGFTSAFVDRVKSDKGTIHRVRVRFRSEADARAAVPKLQPYTTEKVLVTTK